MRLSSDSRSASSFSLGAAALLFISIGLIAPGTFAHKGEDHSKAQPNAEPTPAPGTTDALSAINQSYLQTVKPIFKRSCFDCHSTVTNYPWYSKLPGASWLIKSDITEARSHVDMTADFPFKSHSTPNKDLEAIRESISEGSMPPLRYRALHWDSALSDDEKKQVMSWIELSLKQLKGQ